MYKMSPSARCYPIPDEWFEDHGDEHYVDIIDIQNQNCPLVPLADRPQHAQRATFNINGIYIDHGTNLRGVLEGDTPDNIVTFDVYDECWLPIRFKRIYFAGTDCKGLKILGQNGNE